MAGRPKWLRIGLIAVTASCAFTMAAAHRNEYLPTPYEGLVPSEMLRAAAVTNGACERSDRVTMITGISASDLSDLYQSVNYDLDSIRDGDKRVPKILVADLPTDLRAVKPIDDRKALFVKSVLPAILYINARIEAQRKFVKSARARARSGESLSDAQQSRLAQLAECYDTGSRDFDALLRRVDVVPPALALAQAAIESRWGTSHFARRGNAILGQHTNSKDGIVPAGARDANFRVRSFGHMPESVAAFIHNLNTHPAYRAFREMRSDMRRKRHPLDSMALAGKLLRYSTRRGAYVHQVREMIRSNHFKPFDSAQLKNTGTGLPDDTERANSNDAGRDVPPQKGSAASSARSGPTG